MSFAELEESLIALYARGEYEQALVLLHSRSGAWPAQWERVAYWRVCLLARLGHTDEAVDVLAQAYEAGAWWAPRLLETEGDLDQLWGHPGLAPLLAGMEQRRLRRQPAYGGLWVGGSRGGRPVVALHGRNQVFEVDAERFSSLFGPGWELAVVESRQRIASDGPTWDDPELCRSQVAEVTSMLWPGREVMLAGFSQGGRRVLQLGLSGAIATSSVLAVAPMLRRPAEMAEVVAAVSAPPWPPVVMVVGEDDPAGPGAETVARHLSDEGVEVHLDLIPGRSHEWLEPSAQGWAVLEGRA